MELRIRPARPEDSPALTRVARAAKAHWGYPAELMRLWKDELALTPEFVLAHPVFCAVQGSKIAGFYALTGDGDTRELEHMWVDPECMGRGIGRLLLEHAVEQARESGCRRLQIASDPGAEGFYRKLGAEPVGEVPSDPAGRTLPLLELRIV